MNYEGSHVHICTVFLRRALPKHPVRSCSWCTTVAFEPPARKRTDALLMSVLFCRHYARDY